MSVLYADEVFLVSSSLRGSFLLLVISLFAGAACAESSQLT